MPKKPADTPVDDLLSLDTPAPEQEKVETFTDLVDTPQEDLVAPDITPVTQDDEDAEIAALKAALAKPLPVAADDRPKKDSELTPKERELRDLRDQMARRQALIAENSEDQFEDANGKDVILMHTLVDGFTINGVVTYRGQEFEFPVGGKAYEQTKNIHGKSWLDLTTDEQYERWGEAKFGMGPWPFRRLSSLTLADLPEGSTEADLEAVKRAAAKNDRRAPVASA